mmetsp:Transcript_5947/g.13832  ORF Transcript_5947/g.13832 Transcript_5947/m.13832 type:complete len:302 (-) Transcript_5947:23-928(-)
MFRSLVRALDCYGTLGLTREATQAQVRAAYLMMVRKHHPDVSSSEGSEERFQRIQAAWEILRDPEARARLDRGGENRWVAEYRTAARNTPRPWPSRRETQTCREFRARQNLQRLNIGMWEERPFVRMNFERATDNVDDDTLWMLAEELPPDLDGLALKFEGCYLTDRGLNMFAAGLKKWDNLRILILDFTDCQRLTDEGLQVLAESLPETLLQLSLDLTFCRNVGDDFLISLSKLLPDSVAELRLGLLETSASSRAASIADDLEAFRHWTAQAPAKHPSGPRRNNRMKMPLGLPPGCSFVE